MLSAIFVDRPRLAVVIAIVTTIAGLLALYAIPIAQYPDIVPPQVSVTTFYPGANSGAVEPAGRRAAPGDLGQEEVVRAARRDRALFAQAHPRPALPFELRYHQHARWYQEHAGRR